MNDVKDILQGAGALPPNAFGPDYGSGFTKKVSKKSEDPKRPEGMNRELYALLCSDGSKNMGLAPLLPTEKPGGYKKKVVLSARRARKWKWTPFTNPARSDGAVFYHWRRELDEVKEYPFAKFNKEVPIPQYSEQEYANNLEKEGWTKEETDHLFDLARRFALRFTVIQDRYEKKYPKRSVEDIKERYYGVTGLLTKLRAEPGHETKVYVYDADHERRRKEQLSKLWAKTPEQIEEEEFLKAEIKKIEARKKEREKKTQDLQKLITAADGGGMMMSQTPEQAKKMQMEGMKKTGLSAKKKSGKSPGNPRFLQPNPDTAFCGIKYPDFKTPGVSVRSSRLKLPGTVGQKKAKAIETMTNDLGVATIRAPTDEICQLFNEFRSDIVLHYELKQALHMCNLEMLAAKHQYEAAHPGEELPVPKELDSLSFEKMDTSSEPGILIHRKRKAAIEQGNMIKKLKNKQL